MRPEISRPRLDIIDALTSAGHPQPPRHEEADKVNTVRVFLLHRGFYIRYGARDRSTHLYLFDPKYKLDSETSPQNEQVRWMRPQKEDVDKMHAYRDAIRGNEQQHVVRYAAILYPGPEERYANGIEAISAIPDCPKTLHDRVKDVLIAALDPSLDAGS